VDLRRVLIYRRKVLTTTATVSPSLRIELVSRGFMLLSFFPLIFELCVFRLQRHGTAVRTGPDLPDSQLSRHQLSFRLLSGTCALELKEK
jgi:hypothetical protein